METCVTLVASATRTRVLVMMGQDEVLRASLPPLNQVQHHRAVTTLLEALSLWTDTRLFVALCAADEDRCFWFGLIDELGAGARSVYYAVELLKAPTRRRGRRLQGVADFGDVRQLSLIARSGGAR